MRISLKWRKEWYSCCTIVVILVVWHYGQTKMHQITTLSYLSESSMDWVVSKGKTPLKTRYRFTNYILPGAAQTRTGSTVNEKGKSMVHLELKTVYSSRREQVWSSASDNRVWQINSTAPGTSSVTKLSTIISHADRWWWLPRHERWLMVWKYSRCQVGLVEVYKKSPSMKKHEEATNAPYAGWRQRDRKCDPCVKRYSAIF